MIPQARIAHSMPLRVRFKIDSQKGDIAYFADVAQTLAEEFKPERLEANPATGSVLIENGDLEVDSVVAFAAAKGLFHIPSEVAPAGLVKKALAPLSEVSSRLKEYSSGQLDLASIVFFALIGVGVFQILRGNLRSPPWYTAFWYAMGVYLKSLAEKKGSETAS